MTKKLITTIFLAITGFAASAQKFALSLQTGFAPNVTLQNYPYQNTGIYEGFAASVQALYQLNKHFEAGVLLEGNSMGSMYYPYWTTGLVANKKFSVLKLKAYTGLTAGYNFIYHNHHDFDKFDGRGVTVGVQFGVLIPLSKHFALNTSISARYVEMNWRNYYGNERIEYYGFKEQVFTLPIMVGVRYAF